MPKYWKQLTRLACVVSFFIEQNRYFGWNHLPKSDTELIADGITLLLFAIVFI